MKYYGHVNWLRLVNDADKSTNRDNVVSGLKSSIKTMFSDETQVNKAIALRYLLHLVGDLHMPFHSGSVILRVTLSIKNSIFPLG